jgi:uncharacterized damage-inducible protein DinB
MAAPTAYIQEFEQEMPITRRVLERVPADKATWKPHEKSFAIGHLAQLVGWMPGWIGNVATETELDVAGAPKYSLESTESIVANFDKNVAAARAALAAADDSTFGVMWSLKHGDRVLFSGPRGAILRNHMNHLIHHRGQLTVYLRLLDVPVPQVYGPTADEKDTRFQPR